MIRRWICLEGASVTRYINLIYTVEICVSFINSPDTLGELKVNFVVFKAEKTLSRN